MQPKSISLQDLAAHLDSQGYQCSLEGDRDVLINGVNTLNDATQGDLSFLSNPKYRDRLLATAASAAIIGKSDRAPGDLPVLRCDDPYAAVTLAIIHIYGYRQHPVWDARQDVRIAETASVGANANIGPYTCISDGATIGANATIYPGCYIGKGVSIGDDVVLYPNVVIYDGAELGDRVTLHAGTVIGEDGLGYAPVDGKWMRIPAVGKVVIEDDVEIGACCAIDNATIGKTRVGKGTKFGNSIVVGHGCDIGEDCIFVAQIGLAGSVKIGDKVQLAGQVGVCGHTEIGDGTVVQAKSLVWSSLESGKTYQGNPAIESRQHRKQMAMSRKLPDIQRRVRELEQEIKALQALLA